MARIECVTENKYLAHVQRSAERLGYIKPEYAERLASLMNEYEGFHPREIARKFRQSGTPLSRDDKKVIGIRANADMTSEALAALTEKGLTAPLKGIEATLLDATFAHFREHSVRSVAGTEIEPVTTFHIRRAWPDCPGCARLDGQEILPTQLDMLPPPDCANEACALGIKVHVDYLTRFAEQHRRRQEIEEALEPKRSWLARLFGL